MNNKSRQPARRRLEYPSKAKLLQKGISPEQFVEVHRGDLVRELEAIPDSELGSFTARMFWQRVCISKRVACEGVQEGGEEPPRRPTRSQSSQMSQVLAERRARAKVHESAGRLAHPRSAPSSAQVRLALSLLTRYRDAGAVLAEFELLQGFVVEAGGADLARNLLETLGRARDEQATLDQESDSRKPRKTTDSGRQR